MALGLGPLMNTLQGLNANTFAEALAQTANEELTARAKAALEASQQAGQQYQEAAGQPQPDVDPLQQVLLSSLGNVASVIGQDPQYRQTAQQQIAAQRKSLLESRAANLQAMRDLFSQKAEAAQKAGDLEAAEKARIKFEQLSKTHEQILQTQRIEGAKDISVSEDKGRQDLERLRQKGNLAEIAAKGAQDRLTDKAKPEVAFDITPLITTTDSGRQFVDLGSLTGKEKNAAIKQAGQQGLIPLATADAVALRDVDRARRDMNAMEEYLQGMLPKDAKGRALNAPGMKISKALQTNEQRAAWRTFSDAAIPTLRALAGSRGLRITQQQIELTIKNLPRDTDTIGTAKRKFQIIRTLLDNSETPLVTRNWGGKFTEAKQKAYQAARTGDDTTLESIVRQFPVLDNDPELTRLARGGR